jgi:hypothetical protein
MAGALMVERSTSPNELEAAIVGAAVAALDGRVAALRAKASLGITVVDGEHGSATIVSSEAAAALKLAGGFEAIAGDLRNGSGA